MTALNRDQRNYCLKRVEEIKDARTEVLREKHTKVSREPPKAAKVRAVRNFEFRFKGHVDLRKPLGEQIEFTYLECSDELDRVAFRKDVDSLRKAVGKVSDEIMLGDADKARDMLSKLEARLT